MVISFQIVIYFRSWHLPTTLSKPSVILTIMPFVHCIAEQDASIIVSPRVGCELSSSTSTKAAVKTTQEKLCNADAAELFEQWGALIEREGNEAYAIFDTIQDLGKVEDEARQQLCIR